VLIRSNARKAETPAAPGKSPAANEDVANWNLLTEDTRHNEAVRRLQIHGKLLEATGVRPEQLTRWLYKEVLHADLDDPYLGLGKTLFAN